MACLVELGYHLYGFTPNLTSISCPVEFDRSNFKFNRAWNTGLNGCKFTEITLYASLVKLGIIPMNSTGIYLNGFTPNSTGHQILVKMGGNSLRLHLYACLIELGIIPVISTQFEGGIKFYPPSQIRPGINLKWSSEEFPVKNFQ